MSDERADAASRDHWLPTRLHARHLEVTGATMGVLAVTLASTDPAGVWSATDPAWHEVLWFCLGRPAENVLALAAGMGIGSALDGLAFRATRDRLLDALRLLPGAALWLVVSLWWSELDGNLGSSAGDLFSALLEAPAQRPVRLTLHLTALSLLAVPLARLSSTTRQQLGLAAAGAVGVAATGVVVVAFIGGTAAVAVSQAASVLTLTALFGFGAHLSKRRVLTEDLSPALATWAGLSALTLISAPALLGSGADPSVVGLLSNGSPLVLSTAIAAAMTIRSLARRPRGTHLRRGAAVFPGVTIGAEQRPVTASLSPTTVAGSDASGGRRGRLPAGAWSVHLGAGTALAVLASGRLGVSVGQAGIVDDDGFTVGFPDALSVPAVALFAVSTVLLLVALLRLVPAIRTLAP